MTETKFYSISSRSLPRLLSEHSVGMLTFNDDYLLYKVLHIYTTTQYSRMNMCATIPAGRTLL